MMGFPFPRGKGNGKGKGTGKRRGGVMRVIEGRRGLVEGGWGGACGRATLAATELARKGIEKEVGRSPPPLSAREAAP